MVIRLRDAIGQVPLPLAGRWVTLVVVIAVLLAVVIALLRSRRGRNGRRRRLEYALLPDPEFETTSEAVIRFAAQIGRVRRASGLLHHADANSIRLRFRSVGDGQFLTSIVVPQEAAPGLRRAMYPDVETRPISEVVDALPGPSIATGNDRQIDVAVESNAEPPQDPCPSPAPVLELIGPDDSPPGDDPPPRVQRRPHDDPRGDQDPRPGRRDTGPRRSRAPTCTDFLGGHGPGGWIDVPRSRDDLNGGTGGSWTEHRSSRTGPGARSSVATA